jgi:signal transduction histidine kinase
MNGTALAQQPDRGSTVATRRPIRSRLLLVSALGVFTAALSAAALYRAIASTTVQRIERARETIQDELARLETERGAEPSNGGGSYVVGMRAGTTANPGEITRAVPPPWRPFMAALAARVTASGADGEISIPGGHLVARISPASGDRYAWAAMAVKPSPTLQSWRALVVALTISALLLVASAASALIAVKRGTGALQGALNALARDLSASMPATSVREFSDIGEGIAKLARHLAEARCMQERLGRDLARQERLAALGRVVAGVAHEVRNPLASIKLRLDLAMTGAPSLSDELKRAIAHASSEIVRLDRLVSDLLIVSGRPLGPRRALAVGELLRARAETLAPWAAQKGVTIRASGTARVVADPDALGRAIDNLLRNAVEASAAGGTVEATVDTAVSTDGAAGTAHRHRGSRAGRGAGAHHRAVRTVLHDQGRGDGPWPRHFARNRPRPRRRPHVHARCGCHPLRADASLCAERDGARRGKRSRRRSIPGARMSAVLIVEDEAGLRQGLVEVVGAMGHEAWPAAGITEARAALATHAIDCVLLDIRLRDGDGLDYLVRAAGWRARTCRSSSRQPTATASGRSAPCATGRSTT